MSCCNNNTITRNELISLVNKSREAAECAEANCGSSFTNATNAATSATNAANSAAAAAASETNVENIWEDFQERYMGSYPAPPTATQVGALYWNSSSNAFFVWDGTSWVAAPSGFNEFTTFLATGTTTPRNLVTRAADIVNVKDFGAVGDGIADDTAAINLSISNGQGKCIYFPKGKYSYSGNGTLILTAGTTIVGDGKNNSIIKVTNPNPSYIFSVNGKGTGIKDLGFEAGITQIGGSWVRLLGIGSYITDFWMDGDFNGIYFEANAGYIKNGKFDNAASGSTRIYATGGDNSQVIDNVLMGAQPSSPNIAAYGIYVSNNVALTISNTSVIQMGVGLALISNNTSENVLNFTASNCYFDNCSSAVKIFASGTGSVNRVTFNNVWAGNSQGASENGIQIINNSVNEIGGFIFNNCQCVLNYNGAGLSINGASTSVISDVLVNGGFYSDNKNGIYVGKYIYGIKIIGASIGKGGAFIGNSVDGLFVDTNVDNLIVSDNIITFNTVNNVNYNSTSTENVFKNNIGFRTQYFGNATIANGTSSISFPHFCNITPNIQEVILTPRQSLTSAGITSFWISAISPTNITVTANTNVTSDFLFNFYVATRNA